MDWGSKRLRFIMSGAAGFIGSHASVTVLFIAEGHQVIGFDNYVTGDAGILEHLKGNPAFEFRRWDVCQPFSGLEFCVRQRNLSSPGRNWIFSGRIRLSPLRVWCFR